MNWISNCPTVREVLSPLARLCQPAARCPRTPVQHNPHFRFPHDPPICRVGPSHPKDSFPKTRPSRRHHPKIVGRIYTDTSSLKTSGRTLAPPTRQTQRPPREANVHLQQTRRRLPYANARHNVLTLHRAWPSALSIGLCAAHVPPTLRAGDFPDQSIVRIGSRTRAGTSHVAACQSRSGIVRDEGARVDNPHVTPLQVAGLEISHLSNRRMQKPGIGSLISASTKDDFSERLIVDTIEFSWSRNAETMLPGRTNNL